MSTLIEIKQVGGNRAPPAVGYRVPRGTMDEASRMSAWSCDKLRQVPAPKIVPPTSSVPMLEGPQRRFAGKVVAASSPCSWR